MKNCRKSFLSCYPHKRDLMQCYRFNKKRRKHIRLFQSVTLSMILSMISERILVSQNTLKRLFRKEIGITPYKYLEEIRMSVAC